MTGDDKTRFCTGCQKHVHNLGGYGREEAERLIAAKGDSLCVQYQKDTVGRVMTLEYSPVRAKSRWDRWSRWTPGLAVSAAVASVLVLIGARGKATATGGAASLGQTVLPTMRAASTQPTKLIRGDIALPRTQPTPPATLGEPASQPVVVPPSDVPLMGMMILRPATQPAPASRPNDSVPSRVEHD